MSAERAAVRAGLEAALAERVHPDDLAARAGGDRGRGRTARRWTSSCASSRPTASARWHHALGELERDEDGRPLRLRGSTQDITEQRAAEQALAAAAAVREAAAREHRIADELQHSLLPAVTFDPEQLEVATFYQPGVAGTQVGGDWYDVIEVGAGRTALVIGDVMGRGVRAAAVMGQLRTAVRAYARLDLPPADVLEHLDDVVRELGEVQIVTCIYAVFDPHDRTLQYANAGHLPPLLLVPGEGARRLTGAAGPPLGAGPADAGGGAGDPAGRLHARALHRRARRAPDPQPRHRDRRARRAAVTSTSRSPASRPRWCGRWPPRARMTTSRS